MLKYHKRHPFQIGAVGLPSMMRAPSPSRGAKRAVASRRSRQSTHGTHMLRPFFSWWAQKVRTWRAPPLLLARRVGATVATPPLPRRDALVAMRLYAQSHRCH